MINEIVAIYSIIDDILRAMGHQEDCRRQMSDAEVFTTALVAGLFFSTNQEKAREYMADTGLIPKMLSKSRFNRRLHAIADLMDDLFHQLGMGLKQVSATTEYLIDSFPIPVCHNIRINRCRLLTGEEYRGYIASKRCYFYGIRVHLLTTANGIPVELTFLPGSAHDLRGLHTLPLNLPPGSDVYGDKAFNDYLLEEHLAVCDQISLQVQRKKNSHRASPPWIEFIKQSTRHYIETVFSLITQNFPKSIHAVTMKGFLLKVSASIFAFTLEQAFL